jgi:hypothetical protein
MLNEESFLFYPSVLSFSRNGMWDLFVPLNPAWGRWKKTFGRKVFEDRIIIFSPKFTFLHLFLGTFQSCEKRLLASSCLSDCLSVHMDELRSHCTDFYEILYLRVFLSSVGKIQV